MKRGMLFHAFSYRLCHADYHGRLFHAEKNENSIHLEDKLNLGVRRKNLNILFMRLAFENLYDLYIMTVRTLLSENVKQTRQQQKVESP